MNIRLDDWKLVRGCPGLLTDWYNLTDFNTPELNHRDHGQFLSLAYDPESKTCLNENSNLTNEYYLFNIKSEQKLYLC
jgi:hypothetical protein